VVDRKGEIEAYRFHYGRPASLLFGLQDAGASFGSLFHLDLVQIWPFREERLHHPDIKIRIVVRQIANMH